MTRRARIISLFSGKGGVGKSFISLHLAHALAEAGQRTLLVDFDLQAGGALTPLVGCDPIYDVTYTRQVGAHHVEVPVRYHLNFAAAPTRLDRALAAQKQDLTPVLARLQEGYEWVVIDLGNRFDLATVSALSVSHWIWLVTTGDPWTLSQTRLAIQRLEALGVELGRLRVILNRSAPKVAVLWQGLSAYTVPEDSELRLGEAAARGELSERCLARLGQIARELNGQAGDPAGRPTRASTEVARAGNHTPA